MSGMTSNPFRPGAGHMPPYLAGRSREQDEFERRLQVPVLENLVLSGLRGIGKTVLLESLRPIAVGAGWSWVGSELSESAFVSEETLATRLLADLSIFSATIPVPGGSMPVGFSTEPTAGTQRATYSVLRDTFDEAPGLVSDKLRATIEAVWGWSSEPSETASATKGIVFAYDEAQNITDQGHRDQFPLSTLLDVFQRLQRKGLPILLVLAGLPTLLPKLVEARGYSERMFHIITLQALSEQDTTSAILRPIEEQSCPVRLTDDSIRVVWKLSGGYPYFIQFICRDAFDVWMRDARAPVPVISIQAKLDADFFMGRWLRATDRQRELLALVAALPSASSEFAIVDIIQQSKASIFKAFSTSNVTQILVTLSQIGLVYRNRHGRYSLAVPMLDLFIRRQAVYGGAGAPDGMTNPVNAFS